MNAVHASLPVVPGLPVLGNLLDVRRDRVGFMLDVARRYPSLVKTRMGLIPFPVVIVSSPALAGEVLVEQADAFHKAPGLSLFGKPLLGNGLLTSEGDVHKKQRRMMAPSFVQKRITAFAEVMSERAEQAAMALEDGSTVDFAEVCMKVTLEIVGKTLFDAEMGAEAKEIGEALTECLEYIIDSVQSIVPVPPVIPSPRNRRYLRAVAKLDEVILRLIRERRASGRDHGDLLSMLLAARDEENPSHGMDDRQVRDELMTIFLAGHETTANALAWTFHLLAKNPDVRARLEAELEAIGTRATLGDLPKLPYTLRVFKEAMRLRPPAYMVARQALRGVRVGGYPIAKGSIVMINILGIHRDPKNFVDPERFDPDRFLPEAEKALPRHAFMPFGAGSRVCIGNHFALMEGHLLLATFAKNLRLEPTSNAEVQPEPLVTLRPRGGLPMHVHRR